MTQKGHELMTGRRRLELAEAPRGAASSKAGAAGQIECDDALFERLRLLRKRIADEHELRAFVVFSDVALRQMARSYPTSREAFMRISGVGESKLREWGEAFMREIRDYLKDNRKRTFEDRAAAARQPRLGDSPRETLRRFRAGQTVEEIARERELAASTILGHLGAAAEFGEEIEIDRFLSPGQQSEIAAAFGKLGPDNLTGVRELLGERYEYGLLRLYRGCMLRDGSAGNGDEEPRPVTAREEAAVSPSAKDARKAESPGRSPESALAPA
jgi:ATP-dependent DNA helicase RecQ